MSSALGSLQGARELLAKLYSIPAEQLDVQRIRWCMEQVPRLIPSYPAGRDGRGIVICAGGRQRLLQAYTMIAYLREKLGCTLPIDLVYDTQEEMQAPAIALFEQKLDVRCVDTQTLTARYPYTVPKKLRGYMIKPFALLTSSFREVILIDCDNIPLRDPAYLFETAGYREHGVILWRDFAGLRDPLGVEQIYEVLDPERVTIPKHAHETGQVVIDTKRLWTALHLSWFLNNNHAIFYKMKGVHGETDLYQIAMSYVGDSFYEIPYPPKTIGTYSEFAGGIHGHTMGQCDPNGDVLFAHRTCDDSFASMVGEFVGNDEFTTSSGKIALPLAWDWITTEAELPTLQVDANQKWILVPKSDPVAVSESLKACFNFVCEKLEYLERDEIDSFPEEVLKEKPKVIPGHLQTQANRLIALRERGFEFNHIIDIGACHGAWAQMASAVFPDAELFLVEANDANRARLQASGHPFALTLLGDVDKEEGVKFYKGDLASTEGCSMYREQTSYYFDEVIMPLKKLDTLLAERGLGDEKIDLLKIDVQGAELDVLRGATKALESGPFVLLETQVLEYNKGAPMLADIIVYMASIGYQPCDMLEMHFLPNTQMLNQVDVLFAPTGHPVFELPLHEISEIRPPDQAMLLSQVIQMVCQGHTAEFDLAIVDAPGHVVLGEYLECSFVAQRLKVKRVRLDEALPDAAAIYLMPGADVDEVRRVAACRGMLSVTGFAGLVEKGHASIGLEGSAETTVSLIANAGRLAAEGRVMPESLDGITRVVDNA